jgi:hypothetical protein
MQVRSPSKQPLRVQQAAVRALLVSLLQRGSETRQAGRGSAMSDQRPTTEDIFAAETDLRSAALAYASAERDGQTQAFRTEARKRLRTTAKTFADLSELVDSFCRECP